MRNLAIYIGDIRAGNLVDQGGDRSLFFFDSEYLAAQNAPVLGLGLQHQTDFKPVQTRIESWFSNLLPEGHLRQYVAERAGIKEVREYDLLALLGEDLPGNVIVKEEETVSVPHKFPGADRPQESQPEPSDALRFSLAGVQLKFSALGDTRGGLTIPVDGRGGSHIVKLPSLRFHHVPENEFSMMTLARNMGLDVPETSLVPMEDIDGIPETVGDFSGDAFVINRFDRKPDGKRVHIEDFAQVLNIWPTEKYSRINYRNIAAVLASELSEDAIAEFLQRLVFNILIGNGDMHAKNWSLIYPDGRTPELGPAYDFLSTLPYTHDTDMALNLYRGGPKRFDAVDANSLHLFAEKSGLAPKPVIAIAKATVEHFMDLWPAAKQNLPIEDRVATAIDDHLKTLTLPGLV